MQIDARSSANCACKVSAARALSAREDQREREMRVKKKTSRPQKNVDLYFCNS